jgi:hypothetical protein
MVGVCWRKGVPFHSRNPSSSLVVAVLVAAEEEVFAPVVMVDW